MSARPRASRPFRTLLPALPLALALAAAAQSAPVEFERVDLRGKLAPGGLLRIENPLGDIRVRDGGPDGPVECHAVLQQLDPGGARVTVVLSPDGDGLRLTASRPAGAAAGRADLAVFVPRGARVEAVTVAGVIELKGLRGDAVLRSERGDLEARGVEGALDARTGAGAIRAVLARAPAGSRQSFETVTGAIQLQLPPDLDATIDAATSGEITTDFSLAMTRMPHAEPDKRAEARVGRARRARIEIRSRRGAVKLLALAASAPPDLDSD